MSGNRYTNEDADPRGVLDPFTRGYVAALLFAELLMTEDRTRAYPEDASALDRGLDWEDFDESSQDKILADCNAFKAAHAADIEAYGEAEAGADYYFTRAGHGVGFWEEDHGTPEICQRLDEAAHRAGEVSLWITPFGRLVIS